MPVVDLLDLLDLSVFDETFFFREQFTHLTRINSMGRLPRITFPGAIYHAMARGNSGQGIFLDPLDYEKFLKIIKELKRKRPFLLHAFCLMPNHVHLVIEPRETSISTLMGVMLSRYAKYFNLKTKRVGHVFQDRFKAPLCGKDSYFKQLVRYIHLNPVRSKLTERPDHWPYSSHREYAGKSDIPLVDESLLLSMLDDNPERARFLYDDFLNSPASEAPVPVLIPNRPAARVEPCPSFKPSGALPLRHEAKKIRKSLEYLRAQCSFPQSQTAGEIFSLSKTRAVCAARKELTRRALLEGYSLTEIAAYLNISLSAVSRACSRSQACQASQQPAPIWYTRRL